MNLVYIRLIVYVLSTVFAAIPASWAGWIDYDAVNQTVTISLQGLSSAIVGGLGMTFAVFKKWGVK